LVDTLRNFNYYKENAKEQDNSKSTKAPKIKKEMSKIKWKQFSAQQLDQLHRAISHKVKSNYLSYLNEIIYF
jgi:methionyl-tRNA formyltransferase